MSTCLRRKVNRDVLSFVGNGKISVPIESILSSDKVRRQVQGVRKIAATIEMKESK